MNYYFVATKYFLVIMLIKMFDCTLRFSAEYGFFTSINSRYGDNYNLFNHYDKTDRSVGLGILVFVTFKV